MKQVSYEKVFTVLYRIIILSLLLLALGISSMKVKIIFGAIAVVFFVCTKWLQAYLKWILTGVIVVFFGLNVFYNSKNLSLVNPVTKITSQTLYQEQNLSEESYPDSFLRLLVRDKRVLVSHELSLYSDYDSYGKDGTWDNPFSDRYFIDNNYLRYFELFAKEAQVDTSLPSVGRFDGTAFSEDFYQVGIGNDLLRYSFLLNEEGIQESTYFWYSWYYYSYAEEAGKYPKIFLSKADFMNADTLVALWDKEENLYLMSEDYYREGVLADE